MIPPFNEHDPDRKHNQWRDALLALVPSLQKVVAARDGAALQEWRKNLNSWNRYDRAGEAGSIVKHQWKIADRLLQCAEVALQYNKSGQVAAPADAMTPLFKSVSGQLSHPLQQHFIWAGDCISLLQGRPLGSAPVVAAKTTHPIALVPEGQQKGILAQLHLDLIQDGQWTLYYAPEESHFTFCDDECVESIERAWRAVFGMVTTREKQPNFGLRWRITDLDNEPLEAIKGGSAGGAAAYGILHLLQGRKLDPGVLVLATIDKDLRVGPVGGIQEKVVAACDYNRNRRDEDAITTIGVAGDTEAQTTHQVLTARQSTISAVLLADVLTARAH